MRWFVGSAVALLLVWFLYLGSPYWALWRLLGAIEARDPAAIAARVNIRAVRLSLIRQIGSEAAGSRALSGALGSPDVQLTAAAIAAAADSLLEEIVRPDQIAALVPELDGAQSAGASGFRPGRFLSDATVFLRGSRWRGFRNVYFTLPPAASPDRRVRLQLRLTRLRWRLVGIEPTPETRERLLAELVRLKRPGGSSGPRAEPPRDGVVE